jgi:hypothetical protein
MANYLKKFNFLYGIILIIICIIPARIAQDISQALLRLINNIAAYFDFMGVSGGYVGMFYEKLIVEGLGAAVYCGGMLLFPMYLNKNFFKKFEINWLPGIICVFLFFSIPALYIIYIFLFKALGKMDWIDTLSYIVGSIGYTLGFLSIIFTALLYSETKNKFINKILDKFK